MDSSTLQVTLNLLIKDWQPLPEITTMAVMALLLETFNRNQTPLSLGQSSA